MATSFIVISTDLRRAAVKAPAGGYMIDVLEDACTKLKLPSEAYQLKYEIPASIYAVLRLRLAAT